MLETLDRPAGAKAIQTRPERTLGKIAMIVAFAAAVLAAIALFVGKPAPQRHLGRTTLEWVQHGFGGGTDYGKRLEAIDALKALGPVAHAELMEEFTFTYSKRRKLFNDLKKRHPALGLPDPPERERQSLALFAICALKQDAAPLTQELGVLVSFNQFSHNACFALASVGTPEAAELLIGGMKSKDPTVRRGALMVLPNLPNDLLQSSQLSRTATPLLLDALRNGDPSARDMAAYSFSRIAKLVPDEVVEALTQSGPLIAGAPNTDLRMGAVRCLTAYGKQAKQAAPLLISAIEEIDEALATDIAPQNPPRLKGLFPPQLKGWRSALLEALQSVDPKAAEAYAPARPLSMPDETDAPVGQGILRIGLPDLPGRR